MADISTQPVMNLGPMLTSFGEGVANQNMTRAQTGLVGQQAQAASIANQRAQAMLPLYMRAVANFQGQEESEADQSGVAPDADTSAGPSLHPNASQMVDQQLRQKFFVDPTGTPQERKAVLSASITGDPGLTAYATNQRDMNVKSRQAQSAKQANDLYDEMASVATAQDNGATALQTLRAVAPNTAKQIESTFTDPNAAEQAAKDYASHVASAAHQYTGREVTADTGGVMRDKVTGLPVIGTPGVGLSSKEWSDIATKGSEIVEKVVNGRETPMPRYKADGVKDLATWVQQQAAGGKVGAAPIVPTAAAAHAAATAQKMAPAGSPAAAAPPVNPSTPQAARMGSLSPDQIDFVKSGQKAPQFLNTGESKPNDAEAEQQKAYGKDRGDLLQTAAIDYQSGQQTLVNVTRAQNILAKNPNLGPGSSELASVQTAISTWLPTILGGDFANRVDSSPALRQELGKVLGQDQLNKMLKEFHGEGASVRLGAQESNLILGKLSADPSLSRGAIDQMLAWEKSDAQYKLNKARTARAWVNSGNDVQNFEQAFEEKYPRPSNVQTDMGVGKTKPMPSPGKLAAYAATHFGGNLAAARAFLGKNGYKE